MSISRRRFLRNSAVAAGLCAVSPAVRATSARHGPRRVVFVELAGGNDALNTVIPAADEIYRQARPTLGIPPEAALPLTSGFALHPAMPEIHRLFQRGQLAVIAGAGYPRHDRSHLGSAAMWHRGSFDTAAPDGWIGRWCERMACESDNPLMAWVGGDRPGMFASAIATAQPIQLPANGAAMRLSGSLEIIARRIIDGTPVRFFHTALGGFDTHAGQGPVHAALLRELSTAVGRFMDLLAQRGCSEQVLLVIFSEFGRRCRENGSAGTDHGAAGAMLVIGNDVKGGLYGGYAPLRSEPGLDIPASVDFRQCYAAILESWLDTPAQLILGRDVRPIPFL